eukprot:TRINITY_DN17734_c0_g1_i1.p1 TRINITY_DN17734_c0_g1~~TRINITY_DN17734_c0_g1_i1.p1  ORF type:complete len:841 (+),score=150.23 TRINITY_DN17734_c0_g1_i1:342-2525(+)
MAAVKMNPRELQFALEDMKEDKDVVMLAMQGKEGGMYLEDASASLRDDKQVVLTALKNLKKDVHPTVASFLLQCFISISERLRGDKEVVIQAVSYYPKCLEHASGAMAADTEVLTAAKASSLEFVKKYCGGEVPKVFWGDKEFVLAVVATVAACPRGSARVDIDFFAEGLKEDTDVALAIVKNDKFGGSVLEKLGEQMKANKDVVMAAVMNRSEKGARPLQYAAESMKADEDVVIAQVATEWHFRVDETVSQEANPPAKTWALLRDAADSLRNDKAFVLLALGEFPPKEGLEDAGEIWKADEDVVMEAVRHDPFQLEHAAESMRDNKEVVMAAVQTRVKDLKLINDGQYCNYDCPLRFASKAMKGDEDVLLAALQVYPSNIVLSFASEEGTQRRQVLLAAAEQRFDLDLFKGDEPFRFVTKNYWDFFPDSFKGDKELVLKMLLLRDPSLTIKKKFLQAKGREMFKWCSEVLRADAEVLQAATAVCIAAIMAAAPATFETKEGRELVVATARKGLSRVCGALPEAMMADREFVRELFAVNPFTFEFAAEALKADAGFVSELLGCPADTPLLNLEAKETVLPAGGRLPSGEYKVEQATEIDISADFPGYGIQKGAFSCNIIVNSLGAFRLVETKDGLDAAEQLEGEQWHSFRSKLPYRTRGCQEEDVECMTFTVAKIEGPSVYWKGTGGLPGNMSKWTYLGLRAKRSCGSIRAGGECDVTLSFQAAGIL